jgi:hypothetical protein
MQCVELGEPAPKDGQWIAHDVLEAGRAVIETSRRYWAMRPEAAPLRAATPPEIRTCYASAETSPERTANRTNPGTS